MFPTFAPPPPEDPLQPVGKGIVCGPEVQLSDGRRVLSETGDSSDRVTLKAPQRDLATFWTPDSCYAACLPELAPATSFVINIYFDDAGVQTCTCWYVPRVDVWKACPPPLV